MNLLINEFLVKTDNNPHKAYDEYIKYHLLSGIIFPSDVTGIKDFIIASDPEQNKPKKYISKKRKINITMDVNDIMEEIKSKIKLQNDCMIWYKEKSDNYMYELSHSSRETLRGLLCKITNTEFEYKQNII